MNGTLANLTPELMLAAMNAAGNGIIIVDKFSRILYINDSYTRILNVPREKVLHKRLSTVEPEAVLLEALRDGRPRYRLPVEVKTLGKKIIVTITPVLQAEKIVGAVSVFEDITELFLSHQELERAQRLNRSLFIAAAKETADVPPEFSGIIGRHEKFLRCLRLAELVAPTEAAVLVEGESGTGKEVIVNGILRFSKRRNRPFVNINCSAIPESLMESELFGYTAGSFTGAAKGGKAGKFELANGGTIFLDEIGEMPLFMQAKLLRALQSGEIQKIGSDAMQKVDVRVIAATNRNLKQMVKEGAFREDLYFRLNTFTIVIPPLRERGDDVLLLAAHFLQKFSRKYGKKERLSPAVQQFFLSYSWPGNVRQLESCMEYAVIVCGGGEIRMNHLPEEMQGISSSAKRTDAAEYSAAKAVHGLKADIQAMERDYILRVLKETGGNKSKAMEVLGISRRTFYKKWKLYGLDKESSIK